MAAAPALQYKSKLTPRDSLTFDALRLRQNCVWRTQAPRGLEHILFQGGGGQRVKSPTTLIPLMAFLQLSRWSRLSGILLLLLCLSSANTYGHSFVFSATTLSKALPDGRQEMASTGLLRATSMPSSVYVNIPFCRRRCFYCDFPIKVCTW